MDLWSVNQTKASFISIMAHWISIDGAMGKWDLNAQVIAFCGLAGLHSGENVSHTFINLCERAGLISASSTKVRVSHLVLTATNVLN